MNEILRPLTLYYSLNNGLSDCIETTKRYLSDMKEMYRDQLSANEILKKDDPLIYEYYNMNVPEKPGDLAFGTSIVYPGKIGNEYYMTKGHFHAILETAEIYYCIGGRGYMLLETPEGDWDVQEMTPGKMVYVPKRWAHRSINAGTIEPLITFFIFRADAGHNYGSIERKGFRKLIVNKDGMPAIVDNPNWK